MSLELLHPALLGLLPAYIFLVYLIDRHTRRGNAHLKRRVTMGVRCVLVGLCVLALAAPSVLLPGGNGAAWLLIDASDSARTLREQITRSVQTAIENKHPRVDAGVIAFGGNAMVETPLSASPAFDGVNTAVDTQQSCLSGALTLAGALLPAESAGRIAVLSDGLTDDIRAAAEMLRARNIAVDVMQLSAQAVPDAQVTQIKLPSTAYAGQAFSVSVQVDSSLDTAGTLVLYQNRTPVASREVTLRRGENTFVFRDVAVAQGVVTYEARLIAQGDECTQNDSMGAYVYVQGAPQVLLVEGRQGEGSEMSRMLTAAGMQHETVLPSFLPTEAEALRAYDAIVLVNVDYDAAAERQWQALGDAVRLLGRGLCVIGGDSSYALGGYRGTLLEDMLPVSIDVRSKLDMPSLALMLVIDKSGSMSGGMFGTTRMEMAKEAAMRATEVLTPNDQVGVIAFDDAAKWVVPLQNVEDAAAIQAQIGTIRSGGGTAFYTPLYEAVNALMNTEARQKHIIFLTDGEAADSGYAGLADTARENGVTLTTVAVGSGANQTLLRALAQRGEGRFYAADEFDNLPKIFTKETYLMSGSYVQNRVFTPVITHESVLTDFDGFPHMTGYLAATEKNLATVELCSDREDPLLAWWQYGAGRVLCFMGDSRGAWTQELLAWNEAAAFYGGMAAYVLPAYQRSGELASEQSGGALHITYTAPEGGAALETRLLALLPDGTQEETLLTETALGVYTGEIGCTQQGAYALRVEQHTGDGQLMRVMEGGAVNGYTQEYDLRLQDGEGTLSQLAELTGGRMITDAKELLQQPGSGAYRRVELTQGLLWALLVTMVLDVALRRLSWDAALEKYLKLRPVKEEKTPERKMPQPVRLSNKKKQPETAPSETAQRLLDAKQNKKIL